MFNERTYLSGMYDGLNALKRVLVEAGISVPLTVAAAIDELQSCVRERNPEAAAEGDRALAAVIGRRRDVEGG